MKALRWILCFPVAYAASILSVIVLDISVPHVNYGPGFVRGAMGFILSMAESLMPTFTCCFVGILIAPTSRRIVPFVFFGLSTISSIAWYFGSPYEQFGMMSCMIASFAGIPVGGLLGLFSGLKIQNWKRRMSNPSQCDNRLCSRIESWRKNMKQKLTRFFALIGIISLAIVALRVCIARAVPTYEEVGREQFGTEEAIVDLAALYNKVDLSGETPELVAFHSDDSITRNIPRSWLPARYKGNWGVDAMNGYIEFGAVMAYYDKNDNLYGLEFVGSRYGCFVSRDATRCPTAFGTLYRLSTKPIFVSLWVAEEEK